MKDIKFRGKSDNDWVYGFLMKVDDIDQPEHDKFDYFIQTDKVEDEEYKKFYITDNNTLGQYTGLRDKNGVEIYEGDIVQDYFYEKKVKIIYMKGAFWLDYISDFRQYGTNHSRYQLISDYAAKEVFEVIGNIYDNPELLGE